MDKMRMVSRSSTKLINVIAIIFVIGIISLTYEPLVAQPPTPDEFAPIFGTEISVAEWTPDSKTFIFYPGQPTEITSDIPWNIFDTQNRQLTQQNTWPLWPHLTSTEIQTFGLTIDNYKVHEPLYFLGPDGNTLVFARQTECGEQACLYHLVLADKRTQEVFDTNTNVFYPFNLDAFRVIWNNSGNAFVLMQTEEFAGDKAVLTTYVTGYAQGVSHTQATNSIASLQLNGNSYKSLDAFQFSTDDNMLLIRALNLSNDQFALVVYNLSSPNQSILLPDQYSSTAVAAGFSPNNQTRILMFNSTGLMQYDLATGQVIVLNDKLETTQTVRAAWFSPNGEWFAYQSKGGSLYVLRLATQSEGLFTPTFSNTLTLTNTATPTLTDTPTATATLAATDTPTNTPTATFTLTPTPGASDLRAKVAACVTDQGIANSLNAKINANQWQAFINEVQAQSGKKILKPCADDLIATATYILNHPTPTPTKTPTPVPQADMSLTMVVTNKTPTEGEVINYVITYGNSGPNTASGVTITVPLPPGVTLQSANGGGSYNAATGVWTIGSVIKGQNATISLQVKIKAGTHGQTMVANATISATTADPNAANNSASASLTVRQQ